MKKLTKMMAMLAVATFCVVVLSGCTVFNGSSSNMNHTYANQTWTVTAASVNGNLRRNFDIGEENLSRISITATSTEGTIELVLSQGDVTQSIDITNGFATAQTMDFSASFDHEERVQIRLNFDSARNVNVVISWRTE